ncbi:MAG TPA: GNAT family N-acetyltransferase [Gemmataceae bacterium]|nr:GNAT family N-acetyltransferase [Gemmataceae bacterium]
MDAVPEPARTEDWGAAFRLIFQYLPPEEREHRCVNALHLLQRGELNPQGLFLVRGAASPRGALLCLPVPGCTALLWPPGAVEDGATELEDALLRHARGWLRQRGVKLVQTLLAPEESFLAVPLLRNGFSAVTRLWYMRHQLNLPVHHLNTPARLDYQAYDGDSAFQQTLLRTYENTLDCPEVNGVRSIDEVLEGHRAQGAYDPERWWLVRHGSEPVGVLMMTEMPESGDWELAYMGVVPEARRHGFGREMLLHALCEARAADVPSVTLSVDARNHPAWNLYRSLGFEPYDQRVVYLAQLVSGA